MKIHTALALLALAALALNSAGVPRRMPGVWAKVREAAREARTWDDSGFRISSDYLNNVRSLVRFGAPPGAELGMVTEAEGILSSTERSTHIAVAFERLPGRVELVGPFGMLAYDALLLPWGSERAHGADLRAAGFEKKGETLAWELWSRVEGQRPASPASQVAGSARSESAPCQETLRTPRTPREERTLRASPSREACGLALVAAVALCGVWAGGWTGSLLCLAGWMLAIGGLLVAGCVGFAPTVCSAVAIAAVAAVRRSAGSACAANAPCRDAPRTPGTPRETTMATALAIAWTALALCVTLCHTLSPPNGLGVSGGRAALWLLSGGIPEGFFSDPALATFQPSYPPGLALLTLGAWGAAGGVGEWLTQLLALAPFCALLGLLLSRTPGFAAKFWIFALFCTGTALNLASLFYSEGWMLLFLAAGLSRLRWARPAGAGTGDVFLSWFLVGFSGFFKNEGMLFAGLLWIVVRCFRGRRSAPLPALLAGLAPALAWIVFSRWHGGALEDYAPLWAPDGGRFLFALGRVLRDAFLAPWATVFAWPLATAVAVASGVRRFAGSKPASPAAFEGSARSESAPSQETPRSLRSSRENTTPRTPRETNTAREAAALLLLCVPVIAFVYSLSRAPDLDWHVWSSLPRLLWDATAIATACYLKEP